MYVFQAAHNNFRFDRLVLRDNLSKFGLALPENTKFADTMAIMKKVNPRPGMRAHSLDQSLEFFEMDGRNTIHDGMEDTRLCMRIANAAAQKLDFKDYEDYLNNTPFALRN